MARITIRPPPGDVPPPPFPHMPKLREPTAGIVAVVRAAAHEEGASKLLRRRLPGTLTDWCVYGLTCGCIIGFYASLFCEMCSRR